MAECSDFLPGESASQTAREGDRKHAQTSRWWCGARVAKVCEHALRPRRLATAKTGCASFALRSCAQQERQLHEERRAASRLVDVPRTQLKARTGCHRKENQEDNERIARQTAGTQEKSEADSRQGAT
eukprot:1539696-Pleurochrysis_carterae.AAC.2